MSVAVIIPIYIVDEETLQMTRDCIESLQLSGEQLIIVDDYSPFPHDITGSPSGLAMRPTYTHRNQENLGVAKSWNIGLSLVEPDRDVILIANSDTNATNWRAMLPKLADYDVVFPKIIQDGVFTEHLAGEFFLFKKSLTWDIGLFDESYGSYFEDTDFFMRVIEHGGKLGVAPDATVIHEGQATFKKAKDNEWRKQNYERNKALYESRHNEYPYLT